MENTDVNFVKMKGKQEKWNERAPTYPHLDPDIILKYWAGNMGRP